MSVPRPETSPMGARRLMGECRAGRTPAEALSTVARQTLLIELHSLGWTDVEIATLTRMTTYTTARIRTRLGLAANTLNKGAA